MGQVTLRSVHVPATGGFAVEAGQLTLELVAVPSAFGPGLPEPPVPGFDGAEEPPPQETNTIAQHRRTDKATKQERMGPFDATGIEQVGLAGDCAS